MPHAKSTGGCSPLCRLRATAPSSKGSLRGSLSASADGGTRMTRTGIANPAFSFAGVSVRVFPLRADQRALQRLCDTYLNLCPEELHFRPSAPYVLFAALSYARMSYSFESGSPHGGGSQ